MFVLLALLADPDADYFKATSYEIKFNAACLLTWSQLMLIMKTALKEKGVLKNIVDYIIGILYGNAMNAIYNEVHVCRWMLTRRCLLTMLMLMLVFLIKMICNLDVGYTDAVADSDIVIRSLS